MEQMAKVDKRTFNGNNGTSRGKDKKPRKKPTGYYVLKDEVRAGLTTRMELVIEAYGGIAKTAKELGVSIQVVQQWIKRGMISADGAYLVHKSYRRNDCKGFRASFCRPDLRFDSNGKPITRRCDRREMLRVVR
ncbi:hypothetical protein RCIP0078_00025 [Klebsiella phage RCIP0078]|uniref:Uncharacterized protein n=1 Tax=Stenotrophomonas phage vB_SmeS_BUCT705 TaxID=2924899 RepID=A0AAE9K7F9_9CAUD|nr:hypothetical protein [Stenotrophomonas phage vB_SmeS_BUCT705]